jgi:hypothetical protein
MLDEGGSFDLKAVAILAEAFDGVVAEIGGVFAFIAGWAAYRAGQNLMAGFSCASTKRTFHWPAPMSWEAPVRFRVAVVVAAFALAGCNANQAINPSGQAARCANDASCNPNNPSSYAQNSTGIGR